MPSIFRPLLMAAVVAIAIQGLSRPADADALLVERGTGDSRTLVMIDADDTRTEAVFRTGTDAQVSPDGASVLYREGTRLYRASVNSESEDVLLDPRVGSYRWSPDGSRILYTKSAGVHVMASDGSDQREIHWIGIRPVWFPGSSSIMYYSRPNVSSTGDADILRVDIATMESTVELEHHFISNSPSPFSADGTRLFVSNCGDGNSCVKILELETGEISQVGPEGVRIGAERPVWSPDGSEILYLVRSGSGGLFVADLETGTSHPLFVRDESASVGSPVWSSAGDRVAFQVSDFVNGGAPTVYVVNRDGTGLREVGQGGQPIWLSSPVVSSIRSLSWGQAKNEAR